jgi:two-component system response regulator TtrR
MPRSHDLPTAATVFVVDPDPSTGQVIRELLDGSDILTAIYRTGRDFLAARDDGQPGCLVLEQRIPDMSGLQLQHRLAASGSTLPLVFVTSKPDLSTAVELMRGGAIHVLKKPVRTVELLGAIHEALRLDQDRRGTRDQTIKLRGLASTLTSKELQVLELIAAGKSAKAMACDLKLSVRAVELRRNSLMSKLDVHTSLELMRFAVVTHRELGLGGDLVHRENDRMAVNAR